MATNAVIIGSGNIGTDLLIKALRSDVINPVWMVGIDPDSEGLARASELGLMTTAGGVAAFIEHAQTYDVQLAFDATSAYVHPENDRQIRPHGISMVDLTPAAIGPYCVPTVNLEDLIARQEPSVNMVSCGGQATIPIVAAVSAVQGVDYGEIVATIASRSAGPGTRRNIDEFTRTTASAIESIGNAKKGKAIIILNPAEPPLIMRDTIHCITTDDPDRDAITTSIQSMIERVQYYVPGYRLMNGPVFDGKRVSVFLEVEGLGDYLPKFAGNLDIMTAAALQTGEMIARKFQKADVA